MDADEKEEVVEELQSIIDGAEPIVRKILKPGIYRDPKIISPSKPPALPVRLPQVLPFRRLRYAHTRKSPLQGAFPSFPSCVPSNHRVMWYGTANTTWSLYQSTAGKFCTVPSESRLARSSENWQNRKKWKFWKAMPAPITCTWFSRSHPSIQSLPSWASSKARAPSEPTICSPGNALSPRRTSGPEVTS